MVKVRLLILALCVILAALSAGTVTVHAEEPAVLQGLADARATGRQLVHLNHFTPEGLAGDWVLQGSGTVEVASGALVVRALDKEATLWFTRRIDGDVLIEFTARVDPPHGAANLNAFVHATDHSGGPLFERRLSGAYAEYHEYPMYIFTLTGEQEERSDATGWARLRRNPGFALLSERTQFRGETGKTYHVSILIEGGRLRYYLDEELVHDYADPRPHRFGWFAFRTWNTNLTIESFLIRQLRPFDEAELARPQPERTRPRKNLILNSDFSAGVGPDGLPVNWTRFGAPFSSVVDDEEGGRGRILRIRDDDSQRGGGVRSVEVPTAAGTPYRVEVDVLPVEGRGVVYLDFLAGGARVSHMSKVSQTSTGEWETIVLEGTAPQGAETVSVILYSLKPDIATVYFDNVRLYDLTEGDAVLSDRDPEPHELGYRPGHETEAETNPPSFVWLPEAWARSYTLEYSPSPDFPVESTRRVEGLKYAMHMPSEPLEPGTWYWRYWAVADDGAAIGPSRVRSFTVTPSAVPLQLPPPQELRARISRAHPRLFVTPEEAARLKERWNPLQLRTLFADGYLAAAIGVRLPQLPPTSEAVAQSLALLQELGVLYAATGDERYGKAGRDLLLHMTRVEPLPASLPVGTGRDALFMALMTGMSRGYDWLYHALSEEERAAVRAYLKDLGEEAYRRLRTPPFEGSPFNSHNGRILGFLGELSMATLGELPEAETWFDFVVQAIYNVYPAWGGADGGWSEGADYWASYMNFMLDTLDAIEAATGIKLYQKPFFQNTGYYKLYTHPPLTGVPFGDGLGTPIDRKSRVAMSRLAAATGNGHFTWYAQASGGVSARGGIVGALVDKPVPPAKPPVDLPLARHFSDIGLVAMHTDLANPENNVVFQFRSSPYGSVSHSHADQNSFVLYAYGDPLAVSSGYYPWAGSPHHREWTNQTRSKNAILIDGKGQSTFDIEAKGRIEQFVHTDKYDYTVGEASAAYAKNGVQVDSYRRHVVFLRPDLFVVVDDVRTPSPSHVTWLLHSAFPLTWDSERNRAHAAGPKGQLDAHLISGQLGSASVSNEFVPPPEIQGAAPQWHLTLTSRESARGHRIVAVLVPNRAGESKRVELLDAGVVEDGDRLTVHLTYRKDGEEVGATIELELTDIGVQAGPVIKTM